jgi:hypothetical protein
MTAAPRNDSGTDECLTAFSDKCSEHAYSMLIVRETRDGMRQMQVNQAEEYRIAAKRHEATTEKLNKIELAIAAHVAEDRGRSNMAMEVTGEAEIVRKRNWTRLKWAVGVALAAAPGVWVVLREIWS